LIEAAFSPGGALGNGGQANLAALSHRTQGELDKFHWTWRKISFKIYFAHITSAAGCKCNLCVFTHSHTHTGTLVQWKCVMLTRCQGCPGAEAAGCPASHGSTLFIFLFWG